MAASATGTVSESMRRLVPSLAADDTSPSAANGFSRPYATPDEELVQRFRTIPRRSPHKASGQLGRPSAGQQLKPLRAGRPSPSRWPQQSDLTSNAGLAGQTNRKKPDRAKQRRRGGKHVCVCQICGQRTQKPAFASEQLGRLESTWTEIRDHAVWKDAGFSGKTLQALERQLNRIYRQMVSAHEAKTASGSGLEQTPFERAEDMAHPSHNTYPAADESDSAAGVQVEAEHQKLADDATDTEKLTAASKGEIDVGADLANVAASETGGLEVGPDTVRTTSGVKPSSGSNLKHIAGPEQPTGREQILSDDSQDVTHTYLAADESETATVEQVQAEHQKLADDATKDPEKLLAAVKGGNPHDITALIDAGADFANVAASDADGLAGIDRCLVLAALEGHDAAVKVLISAGANCAVQQNGMDVLKLVQKKYVEVARSPPGSPESATGETGGRTLSMAEHRDLLEGLQSTEQILIKASEPTFKTGVGHAA